MASKKILIVDDDNDLREALDTALTQAGFITVVAPDGEAGLASALEHKPDLILLDIKMPKMSGHEMLSLLRKDTWGKAVPVLLLTNFDDPKNITDGFGLNADDYIIKSNVSLKSITAKVKQYIAGYHD